MELVVFTQNNCRFCEQAKAFLNDQEVEYKTINISDEPEYQQKHDLMGAPTIILFDEDEEIARSVGFNPSELETMIDNLD